MKTFSKLAVLGLLWGGAAMAEPVDKNHSGLFLGGGGHFGQSFVAGGDADPGASFTLLGELGYIVKRDTWNRLEISGELGLGSHSFKADGAPKITIEDYTHTLAKFGYGYSLGDNIFGIFRVGAGMGFGTYQLGNFSTDVSSVIGLIGYDIVMPAGDHVDFIFGADWRSHNISPDGNDTIDGDSFQMNTTTIYAKARIKV